MKFEVMFITDDWLGNIGGGTLGFLPRIGESIILQGRRYRVTDIIFSLSEGTTFSVPVEIRLTERGYF